MKREKWSFFLNPCRESREKDVAECGNVGKEDFEEQIGHNSKETTRPSYFATLF